MASATATRNNEASPNEASPYVCETVEVSDDPQPAPAMP